MAFEAPVDDFDPDKSFDSPEPGRYHVSIVKVDEEGGSRGEMVVDYEVLAGSTPNQEGKVHRDYFTKSIKAMGRIHQLAIACGMITADEIKRLKAEGRSPVYDFERDAINKQICVQLEAKEYNGNTRTKCGFGIYGVTDPKVANPKQWPKNEGMLKRAGIVLAPPATAPSAPAAPQVAADDLLNGVV